MQPAGGRFRRDSGRAAGVRRAGDLPRRLSYCRREYGYRPDIKALGSYPIPGGVQFSATYQFSRGVQTGGAGPSILGTWNMTNALLAANGSTLGRNLNAGSAFKSVQLIREGLEYGDQNLSQLDLRASKRFTVRPVPLPDRLRPLQRLQQQLAVHGEHDVLERSRRAPGCGRRARSTAGCSRSAGSSTSSRSFGRARRMAPARPVFSGALPRTSARR